jgi:hypothetical protein
LGRASVWDAVLTFTNNATNQVAAVLPADESQTVPDEPPLSERAPMAADEEPTEQLLVTFDASASRGSLFSAQEWTTADPDLLPGWIVSAKDVQTCAERCIQQACEQCQKANPKLSRSDLGCSMVPQTKVTQDEIDAGRQCVVDTYFECWEKNCNLIRNIFRLAVEIYGLVGTGKKVWSWLD